MAALAAFQAVAAEPAERIVAALRAANPAIEWPSASALRSACGDNRQCYAEQIAGAGPGQVDVINVDHPDTDRIRWVRTVRSVTLTINETGVELQISRFARKVVTELRAALGEIAAINSEAAITLDLTTNSGGDFERALEVAGLLLGPQIGAVRIGGAESALWRDLPGQADAWRPRIRRIRIGPNTASSAEVLAALLQRFGDVVTCGSGRTAGQAIQKQLVTIDHDIRLAVRTAPLSVPPFDLEGGILPEQPCD